MGPSFIIIGAAKAGTNTLFKASKDHKDVFFATPREPAYFTANYDRGRGWYESLFKDASPDQARGEKTVAYASILTSAQASQRMAQAYPETRIVYCLRQPHDRIVSHWRMLRRNHADTPDFETFLDDPVTFGQLLNSCRYYSVYKHYRDQFPAEQIKLFFIEDMERDQEAVLSEFASYIGVDPAGLPKQKGMAKANSADGNKIYVPRPSWRSDHYEDVAEALDEEMSGILKIAGRPADFWHKPLTDMI